MVAATWLGFWLIKQLSELFNSMDPMPFHHCDLNRDAQEYLESWAMGFSHKAHFRIIVHIEDMPQTDPTATVVEAIHNFFDYKANLSKRLIQLLLQEGRRSMLIGWTFLMLCLLGAESYFAIWRGLTCT
jgi:hypothetical protein